MNTKNKLSKSRRTADRRSSSPKTNYYVDMASLLPFLFLLFTGIIMLGYHAGKPFSENTLNMDGAFWLNIHIVFAVISFVMIAVHLSLHFNGVKMLFSGKTKNKNRIRNLILVLLFFATTLASFVPWLMMGESDAARMILGLHNKMGLLLIVFFVIHLLTYFKWLINMTKKEFVNYSVAPKKEVC